ncbi:hypothetical protein L0668_07685 [Paraglaciecola aquimarina]|uniref:Solute-binding protein family 3/N-terminal domain-containing protein n=1 Tax=Paraglaciecola algarum TaxID=3050085 RepID=A0ABS9D4W1_9ALTE|nr:hypothetical protein [Paraglaciecola sp. G1-23]MCF2947983.1 hypothetical protein [Paraglaciecola sp. G1-23]
MKKRVSIWLLCLFSGLPLCVMADTITAYCRDYPPELYFDQGRCVGAVPDLAIDIFAKLGYDIRCFQQPPLGRSVREAKQGNIDLFTL